MRIAFYAPLKPPDHPVPSGDRLLARLLVTALSRAGHEVELASRLRSRDAAGDPARQARLARLGARLAARYARRCHARTPDRRPELWLTYHLYYKAPDWIGPAAAERLDIPYVVAEASVANKRATGPWAAGHAATLEALARAQAVIALNPADVEGLPKVRRLHRLRPFLDLAPFAAAAGQAERHRAELAGAEDLDPAQPWLLTVAMMRSGDKLESYRVLAAALRQLQDLDWRLIIAGDGPARSEVEAAFTGIDPRRLRFLGEKSAGELPALYAAADLYVWPAVREAFGMAFLEAQAAGLGVLAGNEGGVSSVVAPGESAVLVPPDDAGAFAAALRDLLRAPDRLPALGAAGRRLAAGHDLDAGAAALDAILREACHGFGAGP